MMSHELERTSVDTSQGTTLPVSAIAAIAHLRESRAVHLEVLQKITGADNGTLFYLDLIVIAAMHRSLALVDGFTVLVELRNALAAVPLIRLQIDNVIRLYACWLVDDPQEVARALLDNVPLGKIKSFSGQRLTDKALYEAASEHYPWIPEVYRETSGFVHLSARHMVAPISSVNEETRTFTAVVGASRQWTEAEMAEAIAAFVRSTEALIHLCVSWLVTKEQGPMSPEARARLMGAVLPERFRK